ncbi:MAG: AbrB/MazE/SpoVT family DNA-binding domain-containing protein [archaeon]|jgi:antitoxin component of MazEF toxin-antitoxin module|nr:AbrB/MazE/SpoVT family DNA-binding domain-containing protein [archaeon]
MEVTTVKLQKIGNSIRATIPKKIVEGLSLHQGEDMVVNVIDNSILLKKKSRRKTDKSSQFYGVLKEKKGPVDHWPSPEEIKSIWE